MRMRFLLCLNFKREKCMEMFLMAAMLYNIWKSSAHLDRQMESAMGHVCDNELEHRFAKWLHLDTKWYNAKGEEGEEGR